VIAAAANPHRARSARSGAISPWQPREPSTPRWRTQTRTLVWRESRVIPLQVGAVPTNCLAPPTKWRDAAKHAVRRPRRFAHPYTAACWPLILQPAYRSAPQPAMAPRHAPSAHRNTSQFLPTQPPVAQHQLGPCCHSVLPLRWRPGRLRAAPAVAGLLPDAPPRTWRLARIVPGRRPTRATRRWAAVTRGRQPPRASCHRAGRRDGVGRAAAAAAAAPGVAGAVEVGRE
jgi:hypothetical protein